MTIDFLGGHDRLKPGLYITTEPSLLYPLDDGRTDIVKVPPGSVLLVVEVKPIVMEPLADGRELPTSRNGVYCDFKVLFGERVLHARSGDREILKFYKRLVCPDV